MQIKFLGFMPSGEVVVIGSGRLEDLQRQFGPEFGIPELREMGKKGWKDRCETIIEMPEGWEPPTDRQFRNAWRGKFTVESVIHGQEPLIHVDMPHAREIQKEKIRRKRIARLSELDTEYMRADEEGDSQKKKEVALEKKRLRDLPNDPRIENAKTIEDLKKVTTV